MDAMLAGRDGTSKTLIEYGGTSGRSYASGIAASAIAHLSCLMLVMFFTEVHPFGSVTAEPITVDIVTPDEVPRSREAGTAAEAEAEAPDAFDFPQRR